MALEVAVAVGLIGEAAGGTGGERLGLAKLAAGGGEQAAEAVTGEGNVNRSTLTPFTDPIYVVLLGLSSS